ncbi:hypothetical protein SASPL_107587 [Salvia splendens]|uniref:Uncharacterized protein n=1 Tax=Salvia splendens TaxID=180675 RepID=A0A8X8YCP4_SALSN|nr:hypothetical protein SASPL_107587 [Salvia splendens]
MAATTMATVVGAVVLLYYVVSCWISAAAEGEDSAGGDCSKSKSRPLKKRLLRNIAAARNGETRIVNLYQPTKAKAKKAPIFTRRRRPAAGIQKRKPSSMSNANSSAEDVAANAVSKRYERLLALSTKAVKGKGACEAEVHPLRCYILGVKPIKNCFRASQTRSLPQF